MRQALSISALARSTGVTSKTLRYSERVGLLPKANRTHTEYRIFAPEVMRYIDFIRKAKTVGLTLSEMRRVIEVAHDGANPCPEMMQWLDDKDKALERPNSIAPCPATKAAAVSSPLLGERCVDLCARKGTVLPDRGLAKLTIDEKKW